jgi:hypothetical protein
MIKAFVCLLIFIAITVSSANYLTFTAANLGVPSSQNAFAGDNLFNISSDNTLFTNGDSYPLMTFSSGYTDFSVEQYATDYYLGPIQGVSPQNRSIILIINAVTGELSMDPSFNHMYTVPYSYMIR